MTVFIAVCLLHMFPVQRNTLCALFCQKMEPCKEKWNLLKVLLNPWTPLTFFARFECCDNHLAWTCQHYAPRGYHKFKKQLHALLLVFPVPLPSWWRQQGKRCRSVGRPGMTVPLWWADCVFWEWRKAWPLCSTEPFMKPPLSRRHAEGDLGQTMENPFFWCVDTRPIAFAALHGGSESTQQGEEKFRR